MLELEKFCSFQNMVDRDFRIEAISCCLWKLAIIKVFPQAKTVYIPRNFNPKFIAKFINLY